MMDRGISMVLLDESKQINSCYLTTMYTVKMTDSWNWVYIKWNNVLGITRYRLERVH